MTVLSSAGHFAVQRWAREEEKVSMSKPRADSNRTLVTADLKCASGGSVCWPPAHTVPCLTGPFRSRSSFRVFLSPRPASILIEIFRPFAFIAIKVEFKPAILLTVFYLSHSLFIFSYFLALLCLN